MNKWVVNNHNLIKFDILDDQKIKTMIEIILELWALTLMNPPGSVVQKW